MRFRLLNPQRQRARHLGVSLGVSLCAGALFVGPLKKPVWASATVSGDENGPQVQIVQPAYQDVLTGRAKIVIAVRARSSNPQSVEMFVDDKAVTNGAIPLASLPSAQFDWPTTHYPDGPHKLTVRVTDAQGFRGQAEVNIYINNNKTRDTTPPSLQWLNVEGFQQISGTTKVELQALDNFGVKWIFVALNPASDPNRKPPLRSWLLNQAPYSVDFDTSKVPDGLYMLSAKAWDALDQQGEAPPLTIGIVNGSGINATTVGEMLATMREKQPALKIPKVEAPKTNGGDATSTPSQYGTATTAPNPKIAENPSSASAVEPRLSSETFASIARLAPVAPPLKIEAETPQRALFARTAAPELKPRTVASASTAPIPATQSDAPVGTLSAVEQNLQPRLAGRRELKTDDSPTDSGVYLANRIAAPTGEMRDFTVNPTLSENAADDSTRLALNAPLKVEAPTTTRQGRLSNPDFAARSESVGAPALSTSISGDGSRAAVAAPVEADALAPRENAPQLLAPRPPLAAPDANPRVATLPRPAKTGMRGAITAITVSPLEVKTSNAIPTVHVAARATDLRAVAARYGLPVEVVAACNGWSATKKLAAGERVKLPKQLQVSYQGVPIRGDAPAMLVGGTGVAAFRFLFEKQGGTLTWDAKKQRVVAKKGESEITLNIGSNKAKIGDKDVMMELAAFLFEGRTMVPVRLFEEGLNAQVEWNPQTGRLVVAMAG